MRTTAPNAAKAQSAKAQDDAAGFFLATELIIPTPLIERASRVMDAIRHGEYDAGRPPAPSMWNPGDDSPLNRGNSISI